MDGSSSSMEEDPSSAAPPPAGGGNEQEPPPAAPAEVQQPPPEAAAASAPEPRRWTCEACGCNTNTISDTNPGAERSCSVCGTSQSNGSSLLRRAGYAARAGLFARSVAARRGFMNEELSGLDGYEFWSRAMEGDIDMESGVEDDEHAIAALAMEVAGVGARSGGADRSGAGGGPRSIMDAARSFALAASSREPETRLEPDELWRAAEENGTLYQPKWMNPSQIGGRMRTGNGIEVGDGECQNVAYLPLGSGEGRALRALEAFPRSAPFASFNRSEENQERKPRRVFGFKVAFDHPKKEPGKNMGGCYLIGVTTTSFAAFSERNALQQSPFFWGIEDCGNKYEGSRHHNGRESHRRPGQSLFSVEISPEDAPRNEDSVLFGSRQVITCIVDLESRSLTFWRSDSEGENNLLGTLVTGIPRGGQLYPIVVPYNAGSTVAITGMAGDPLPLLSSFVSDWKRAQKEKESQRRHEVLRQQSALVEAGMPTPALVNILRDIFANYLSDEESCLGYVEACRLWYRCGLKLSSLREIFDSKLSDDGGRKEIEFYDYLALIQRIIAEDSKHFSQSPANEIVAMGFEIGEKVELVEGYERFGDAANGPLQPVDRGTVIELQKASSGEITSVRVLHDGRRWWYQPNCVVSEKSGLTDSPVVWFLKRVLRMHGYDPVTLQLFIGNTMTNTSWELGDLVVPKKMMKDDKGGRFGIDDAVGRIVSDSTTSCSLPSTSRGRGAGSVMVEFVSPSFAEGASVQIGSSHNGKSVESRRIPTSRLVHTSVFHGIEASQQPRSGSLSAKLKKTKKDEAKDMEIDDDSIAGMTDEYSLDGGVLSDLQGMKYLDPSAISRIIQECEKTSSSLNSLFEARLPSIALQALDCVQKNMELAGTDESLSHALSSLGKLAMLVARKAFPGECHVEESSSKSTNIHLNDEEGFVNPSSDERHSDNTGGDEGADRSGRGSRSQSVHDRRRMLLSLMSRARRGDVASLGELLNRDITGLPSLDISADAAAALFFGAPGDVNSFGVSANENRDNTRMENSRPSEPRANLEAPSNSAASVAKTLLEDMLRGRDAIFRNGDLQGRWTVPLSSVKNLIAMGIVGNSLPWLKSLLYAAAKKVPRKQSSREIAVLKETTDEDGMPLLVLAISLGCSVEIVRCLIRFGCPVGDREIKLASELDLPEILSVLLRFRAYSEGVADLSSCSQAITSVIKDAMSRQESELLKLRKEADNFLVSFFRKLVEICFSRRWQQQSENDIFGRAVTGALVGNVELCALKKGQNVDPTAFSHATDDSNDGSVGINAYGLIQTVPTAILGKALSSEATHLTTLLLLTEDLLCSKGVNDGGAGLIILFTLLKRFPSLNQSQDMERYGFAELVASHDALASNKLAEITSNVTKRAIESGTSSQIDLLSLSGVLRCPKKHTASLHVTKHASFRCDLCGKGVDKGSIMHGCRQCDWDACETCTDRAEGGMVKWKFIREMASLCQDLLCQDDALALEDSMKEDNEWSERMVENLKSMDNASDVNTLSIRLLQRDPASVRTLATMLSSRGQITIHQFLMVILPALHSSLLGKTSSGHRSKSNRRSKKPRVAGNAFEQRDTEDRVQGSEEERLDFAREVLKHLVRTTKMSEPSSDHNDLPSHSSSLEFRRLDEDDDEYEGSDDEDEDDDNDDNDNERGRKLAFSEGAGRRQYLPGLIRRLHQVLALHEDVITFKIKRSGRKDAVSPDELRSLKNPIDIHLSQPNQNHEITIFAEPLITVDDLSNQLLKTALISHSRYSSFCQKLADDFAIIVERSKSSSRQKRWRVAKIVSYDSRGGWHTINYASTIAGGVRDAQLHLERNVDFLRLKYDSSKTTRLLLSSREYVVIHRQHDSSELKSAFDMDHFLAEGMVSQEGDVENEGQISVVGLQVESDFVSPQWQPYTLLSVDSSRSKELYDLVSDEGEVICGVPKDRIRGLSKGETEIVDLDTSSAASRAERRSAEARQHLSRTFPFLSTRRLPGADDSSSSGSNPVKGARTTLRRTWSALGPLESMRPVEVTAKPMKTTISDPTVLAWNCDFGNEMIQVYVESDSVDFPPSVAVDFITSSQTSPLAIAAPRDTTLVSLLCQLYDGEEIDIFSQKGHKITYTLSVRPSISAQRLNNMKKSALQGMETAAGLLQTQAMDGNDLVPSANVHPASRSRKLSDSAVYSDEEDAKPLVSSDGLDEICIQCLEIIEYMAEVDNRHGNDKRSDEKNVNVFVNQRLSQKLTDQLENPLIVVGGAVPAWCLELPSFSPNVFAYASRKMLLERVAFGVSRSTIRQQEAKVNVGRLRQRMTALRARAVELVGEAFSGGAEDPTALQLQADELYGMEEALGARIRSSFRAEGWQEQSIEVAKAAIHRDLLIEDAMSIMDQYSKDPQLNRRRLEVRFDGESGFDAASGDEAGVTRGFYADVAEALLSCDLVAGVVHSLTCPVAGYAANDLEALPVMSDEEQKCKLPLWIPDLDSTRTVVIPTPRASPSSVVGIFPRPLSKLHPQYGDVLETFRFMGRLFAAAMRDGFMFPLPLSASFLRLVQYSGRGSGAEESVLSSFDLPRPGFTGGEVYAVESHICAALDKIDHANPPPSEAEREREYQRVATDKTFAQSALGMSYECSFVEYFEDRTFVDPLDPSQGMEAHPLCQNGNHRQVTIHNIREWVALAKDFMLHDGVIGQAAAFRAGVDDFFSSEYLRLFSPEELQRDVCGVGDNVDNWKEPDIRKLFKLDGKGATEALVAVAAIGGNAEALSRRFGPSSPTIKFVIKALLEATPTQRRQFLNFVTSVPIVTPGQIEVVPVVSSSGEFMPMNDPGCLPRANTCARRLYLPKFESYESFKKVLWAVVEEEFKHKGFFEWSL